MPRKPITWVGSIIILAAGIFCSWALFQYRSGLPRADTSFVMVSTAGIAAPVLTVLAIFLWYYFNERDT